jgi:MFS family permease
MWGNKSGLVLFCQCCHAYNGQGPGREDPGHIQQGKDYSDFHFYINGRYGHPCLFNDASMFILVGLLWGTGGGFFFPASMAYALDYAGSSAGPAVGTFRALSDLGLALGSALVGLIIPFTGYQIMFLCLALLSLINLSYFQCYVRKKGNMVI